MDKHERDVKTDEKIIVKKDGPFIVIGNIPLVRKVQVVSEYGEPLTWEKVLTYKLYETYALCRCGHSSHKPFCDGTHHSVQFDGTETADVGLTADRQVLCAGGRQIVVKRDISLCINSGFCGDRFATLEDLVSDCDDTRIRSLVIAMIERCPSGSFTYSLEENGPDLEPDLPRQVAVTVEITSDGPIMGPLWVTGNIRIERADGQPLESRNRVTLCRCGLSKNKPLCDGTHRAMCVPED